MRCLFCGSDDLTVLQTFAKDESIMVKDVLGTFDGNVVEVAPTEVKLSVTRRRVKCKNCHQIFWTVEHFEKTPHTAKVQKMLQADYMLFTDPGFRSDLTEDEKNRIKNLLEAMD